MTWKIPLALFGVLLVVASGLVWYHHVTGPRFEVSAVERSALSQAECRAQFRSFGFFGGYGQCPKAEGHPWFHAVVRNVGKRGGYVFRCWFQARDAQGEPIPGTKVALPMEFTSMGLNGGPHIDAGGTLGLDWYFARTPPGSAVSFGGSCSMRFFRWFGV
jgi:hypothetical protein